MSSTGARIALGAGQAGVRLCSLAVNKRCAISEHTTTHTLTQNVRRPIDFFCHKASATAISRSLSGYMPTATDTDETGAAHDMKLGASARLKLALEGLTILLPLSWQI